MFRKSSGCTTMVILFMRVCQLLQWRSDLYLTYFLIRNVGGSHRQIGIVKDRHRGVLSCYLLCHSPHLLFLHPFLRPYLNVGWCFVFKAWFYPGVKSIGYSGYKYHFLIEIYNPHNSLFSKLHSSRLKLH